MPEAKGAAAPSDSLLEIIDAADLVQLRVSLVSLAAQEQEEDGGRGAHGRSHADDSAADGAAQELGDGRRESLEVAKA